MPPAGHPGSTRRNQEDFRGRAKRLMWMKPPPAEGPSRGELAEGTAQREFVARTTPSRASQPTERHVYFPTLAFVLPRSAEAVGAYIGFSTGGRRGLRIFPCYGVTIAKIEEKDLEVRNNPKRWDGFYEGNRYLVFPSHFEAPALSNGCFLRFWSHLFRPCRSLAESKVVELTYVESLRRVEAEEAWARLVLVRLSRRTTTLRCDWRRLFRIWRRTSWRERKKRECRQFGRFAQTMRLDTCAQQNRLECERVDVLAMEYPLCAPPARIGSPFFEWIFAGTVNLILEFCRGPSESREPVYTQRLKDDFCDCLCWWLQRMLLLRCPASWVHGLASGSPSAAPHTRALNCRYEFGFSIIGICRNPVRALADLVHAFIGWDFVRDPSRRRRTLTRHLHNLATGGRHPKEVLARAGGVFVLPALGRSEIQPGDLALIIPPCDAGSRLYKAFLDSVRKLQNPEFLWGLQPVMPTVVHPRKVREAIEARSRGRAEPQEDGGPSTQGCPGASSSGPGGLQRGASQPRFRRGVREEDAAAAHSGGEPRDAGEFRPQQETSDPFGYGYDHTDRAEDLEDGP